MLSVRGGSSLVGGFAVPPCLLVVPFSPDFCCFGTVLFLYVCAVLVMAQDFVLVFH